jgi:hypothetical protein
LFFPFLQNFFTSAMCLSAGQKKIFKAWKKKMIFKILVANYKCKNFANILI